MDLEPEPKMPSSPLKANAKFEMPSWDEKSIVEYDEGRKLTHAKVTKKNPGLRRLDTAKLNTLLLDPDRRPE